MNPLKHAIERKLESLGMTREALAQRMGYRNIPKGLRRLDDFIEHLSHRETLLPVLESILADREGELREAATLHARQLLEEQKRRFKPWLQIIPSSRPSPLFVAALCPGLLNQVLPEDIATWPEDEQFTFVRRLFREHQTGYPQGWVHGKGFIYQRHVDESLEFDDKGHLVQKGERLGHAASLRLNSRSLPEFVMTKTVNEEEKIGAERETQEELH